MFSHNYKGSAGFRYDCVRVQTLFASLSLSFIPYTRYKVSQTELNNRPHYDFVAPKHFAFMDHFLHLKKKKPKNYIYDCNRIKKRI